MFSNESEHPYDTTPATVSWTLLYHHWAWAKLGCNLLNAC